MTKLELAEQSRQLLAFDRYVKLLKVSCQGKLVRGAEIAAAHEAVFGEGSFQGRAASDADVEIGIDIVTAAVGLLSNDSYIVQNSSGVTRRLKTPVGITLTSRLKRLPDLPVADTSAPPPPRVFHITGKVGREVVFAFEISSNAHANCTLGPMNYTCGGWVAPFLRYWKTTSALSKTEGQP
jgi:hypothetical protein